MYTIYHNTTLNIKYYVHAERFINPEVWAQYILYL